MKTKIAILALLFATSFSVLPAFAFAQVRINEVAWMGSSDNANAEWVELYNDSDSEINLTGWTLAIGDTSVISLKNSIAAQGYFLMERTSDNSVPGVPMDMFYAGALSNDGKNLILKDSSGTVVQDLGISGKWPAGNNTTKQTMQWNGSAWITAEATPKAANALVDSDGGTGDDDDGDTDGGATTTATTTPPTSGGGSYSCHTSQSDLSQAVERAPAVGAGRARLAAVGADISFKAYKDIVGTCPGTYTWSFGDGTTATGEKVSHHYDFAGQYQVVLNVSFCNGQSVARTVAKIVEPQLAISNVEVDSGFIEIENKGEEEINLGQWKLMSSGSTFAFPDDTIISASGRIKIPLVTSKLALNSDSSLVLASPLGQTANAYPLAKAFLADISKKIETLRQQINGLKLKRG